jgi:hypothetical protein
MTDGEPGGGRTARDGLKKSESRPQRLRDAEKIVFLGGWFLRKNPDRPLGVSASRRLFVAC